MKTILMSIRPEWVAKILNGNKTIEIRKKFPKDYVGWVYIYCTKDSKKGWCMVGINENETYYQKYDKNAVYSTAHNYIGNGKVVARFWCDKVEKVSTFGKLYFLGKVGVPNELSQLSCLSQQELDTYLQGKNGYAIPIANLSIFDKPREIGKFKRCLLGYNNCVPHNCRKCPATKPLTHAPQSWCYVEVLL